MSVIREESGRAQHEHGCNRGLESVGDVLALDCKRQRKKQGEERHACPKEPLMLKAWIRKHGASTNDGQ